MARLQDYIYKTRIFKKFTIPIESSYKTHEFFLNHMAYLQWNNKIPFVSGPSMICHDSKTAFDYWEYGGQIQHNLKYYMKPYDIQFFGCNIGDDDKHTLLIRLFMNVTKESNNVLVLMENLGKLNEITRIEKNIYMTAINNRSWQPNDWDTIKSTSIIPQSLEQCDLNLNWKYRVNMYLQ